MIPENKQAVVERALQSAFGCKEFESIEQLTKGLSTALIFKIVVRGEPYLLRVITRTDAVADPTHYFACMEIAGRESLGPPIFYLSREDRILVTGFVNPHPFPLAEARQKMPQVLRKLHSLPKFPFRINYFTAMGNFVTKLRASEILEPGLTDDLFEIYDRIATVYPTDDLENWVSCHNDLKPENIIYDGQRPWLVDWEAAFLNDRYLDLTVVANFVVRNEEEEIDFLEQYFEMKPTEYMRAQFFLMQQLLHVFAFTMFILVGSGGEAVPRPEGKNRFREFHDRIWSGEIDLAIKQNKLDYAWVHFQKLLENASTDRFRESMNLFSMRKI